MDFSKSKITLKVLISYIVLGVLSFIVGHFVFAEIDAYTQLQKDNAADQNKILHVGKVLSLIYENDGLARTAIQSKSWEPFDEYKTMNDSLNIEIDSLSLLLNTKDQTYLLDSIKILISKKESNIQSLKTLKSQDTTEAIILRTLDKLRSMESSLGRLTIKDFVSNPENLDSRTKGALDKYIAYLNENAPKDTSNTINEKTLDSVFKASTKALEELQTSSSKQQASIVRQENKLIANDLLISQQIRKILSAVEEEVIAYSNEISLQRKTAIDRSKDIITWAAIAGIGLIILFSVLILNDFWKSQRYRKELEKTTKKAQLLANTREQLVNMVSHDLRSPLSTIVGYGELLQKSLQNKEKSVHYINKIKNSSAYMNRLVEDLLDYSRLEAGKIALEEVSFNLDAVIRESAQNTRQQYNSKPIYLHFEIDTSLKNNIISDPYRIKQILHNLIGNAYKFTEKGSVTIKAYIDRNTKYGKSLLSVEVIDTGIGIREENQDLVFSEFTQVDEDIKKKKNGYGLGLAISKKLAQLLKGDLTFTSEAGTGSCFKLIVPIRFSDNIHKEKTSGSKEGFAVPFSELNLKAIVIDDDDTLRSLIAETLSANNCTVYTCKDGTEAIKLIREKEFDFIITDIQLPKMNGFRFVELLKKELLTGSDKPIIAITGRKDIDKAFYRSNGFSEIIFKPFTSDELIQNIAPFFVKGHKRKQQPDNNPANRQGKNPTIDLRSLKSFVPDEDSLKEILKVFVQDTKKNLTLLDTALNTQNFERIKAISHKMLTMFKQLEAHGVTTILHSLENTDSRHEKTVERQLESLHQEVQTVLDELDKIIN